VKYLGKQNGFAGGSYLNLTSSVELEPGGGGHCSGGCSVLGTTRALGLARSVARHGVRTTTIYQPTIDYPELNMAAQITDDEHTPYNTWSRCVMSPFYGKKYRYPVANKKKSLG